MQACNQDCMCGGGGDANKARVDKSTEMHFFIV